MSGDWQRRLLRVAGPVVPAAAVLLAYWLGAAGERPPVLLLALSAGMAGLGYGIDRRREALAAQDARFIASLDVTGPTVPVPRYADTDGVIDAWLGREEAECQASLKRAQAPAHWSITSGLPFSPVMGVGGAPSEVTVGQLRALRQRNLDGEDLTEDEAKVLDSAPMTIAEAAGLSYDGVGAAFRSAPDTRTPEEYEGEIAAHLTACRETLTGHLVRGYIATGQGLLRLTLHNPGERVFEDVVVVVHLPGLVEAFDPDDVPARAAEMPARPKPFGTRSPLPGWDALVPPYRAQRYLPGPAPLVLRGPDIQNLASGMTVTYPPVSLRPGVPVTLDDVHLIIGEAPGTTVTGEWAATSPTAPGKPTGSIDIRVSDDPLDVASLLADLVDQTAK